MLNHSNTPSEHLYEALDNIIPVTFFATFLCFSLLGLGCVYLKKQDLSFKLACAVSKVTFSSLEDSTEGRSTTYKLFGTRISTHLLALSFMVTSATLACAAVVAWEVFLLEESDNCDSGFDCFDDANGTYIEDCDDFVGRDVSCYKLVYRFDLAIGAVGGSTDTGIQFDQLLRKFCAAIMEDLHPQIRQAMRKCLLYFDVACHHCFL